MAHRMCCDSMPASVETPVFGLRILSLPSLRLPVRDRDVVVGYCGYEYTEYWLLVDAEVYEVDPRLFDSILAITRFVTESVDVIYVDGRLS
jgi:hypothetical protein